MLRTRRPLLALLALGVLLAGGYLLSAVRAEPDAGTAARSATATANATPTVRPTAPPSVPASGLPAEARRTLALIEAGGPFPYERDGAIFGNLERLLPAHPRGWYREYTVPTPGEPDRGALRIVAGRDGSRYYTADHYESFALVDQDR